MNDKDPLNSFVTWLAAAVVGSEFAAAFSPFMIILVFSTAGSLVALGRRPVDKKPTGFTYVFIVNALAVAITGIASVRLAPYVGVNAQLLVAPVALIIGWVGLDWDQLLPYLFEKYQAWRAGGRTNG